MVATHSKPSSAEEQDFFDLFLDKGNGKYAMYMYAIAYLMPDKKDEWARFIVDNPDYYFYKEEIDLVLQNQENFRRVVGPNKHIIDIGPGSEDAILHKTLKALGALDNIKSYTALDIEQAYANNAAKLVKKELSYIPVTSALSLDFMVPTNQKYFSVYKSLTDKVFMSFSCFIHNLLPESIETFFKAFSDQMNPNELLMIGLETNQEPNELIKSYDGAKNLTKDIMRFFHYKFGLGASFDPEAFNIVSEYSFDQKRKLGRIGHYAVSLKDQKFTYNNREVEIKVNDKFFMWSTMRFTEEFIRQVGAQYGLQLKETLNTDKKRVKMFVLAKN